MSTTLIRSLSLAASIAFVSLPAAAHVTLEKSKTELGKGYKAVLRVPHGCEGEPTTTIKVEIPEGYIGVKPMPKPGWKVETTRAAYAKSYAYYHGPLTEGVTTVTWSGGELPDDFYDEFVVSGFIAREQTPGPLYFKVQQKCTKGEIYWSEIPAAGVDAHSLKAPAAVLKLVAGEADDHAHHGAGAAASETSIGKLAIETPWARATPAGARVGAGYVTIRNTGTEPDTLIGVEADFAGRSEIHEMTMTDGVMRMRELADGLTIPPGGSVELKPGDTHLMFLDLKSGLKAGEPVKAKLKFRSGAEGVVDFSVAPVGAGAPEHKHN